MSWYDICSLTATWHPQIIASSTTYTYSTRYRITLRCTQHTSPHPQAVSISFCPIYCSLERRCLFQAIVRKNNQTALLRTQGRNVPETLSCLQGYDPHLCWQHLATVNRVEEQENSGTGFTLHRSHLYFRHVRRFHCDTWFRPVAILFSCVTWPLICCQTNVFV